MTRELYVYSTRTCWKKLLSIRTERTDQNTMESKPGLFERLPYTCTEEKWHLDRTYQTYNGHTFKTGSVTLIYYPSTTIQYSTTIQLQGKLSTEIVAKITFLKETLKNMDEQIFTTRSLKNTDSSHKTSYLSSLRSSHSPVALDIKTPDNFGENSFSGPAVSYFIPKGYLIWLTVIILWKHKSFSYEKKNIKTGRGKRNSTKLPS